jgi:hypothetical protein
VTEHVVAAIADDVTVQKARAGGTEGLRPQACGVRRRRHPLLSYCDHKLSPRLARVKALYG